MFLLFFPITCTKASKEKVLAQRYLVHYKTSLLQAGTVPHRLSQAPEFRIYSSFLTVQLKHYLLKASCLSLHGQTQLALLSGDTRAPCPCPHLTADLPWWSATSRPAFCISQTTHHTSFISVSPLLTLPLNTEGLTLCMVNIWILVFAICSLYHP